MLIRGDNASSPGSGPSPRDELPDRLAGHDVAADRAAGVAVPPGAGRALRARLPQPYGYVTLEALAEVLIKGEAEQVPAAEVARNVDRYLSRMPGRGGGRGGRAASSSR